MEIECFHNLIGVDGKICWQEAETILGLNALFMEHTRQDVSFHREGNVLQHTKMVCDKIMVSEAYSAGDDRTKLILLLAALMHDMGKIHTTRMEDGHLRSPGHARLSSEMARSILWQVYGLCGTAEKAQFRETICNLIRWHGLPTHAITEEDGLLRLLRFASDGELLPGCNGELLCTLAEADILGRICDDQQELLERVALCRELAKEYRCLNSCYPYPSSRTAYAHLNGKNVPMDYPVYDDSWGEVILMSGLPGTGKDTWIQEHYPNLPMISLDEIRLELGIAHGENQDKVLAAAREQAKELLRRKQSFVWNATNLIPAFRKKQVDLAHAYGASTRIVYLETTREEQKRRNEGREDVVPVDAVLKMQKKLIPPDRYEATNVEWHFI